MGGSSSKKSLFGRKKKKPATPWGKLKRALGNKKHKRKTGILPLDKLNLDNLRKGDRSQKRFSLAGKRKKSISIKEIFTNKPRKESGVKTLPLGRKQGNAGGMGKVGEKMKRLSLGNTNKISPPPRKRFSLADLKPSKRDQTKAKPFSVL